MFYSHFINVICMGARERCAMQCSTAEQFDALDYKQYYTTTFYIGREKNISRLYCLARGFAFTNKMSTSVFDLYIFPLVLAKLFSARAHKQFEMFFFKCILSVYTGCCFKRTRFITQT